MLRERRTVLPIVEAFLALKRERESLDFADQMAIAARLTRSMPAVGEIERERFRAVLLDEFQDTSEAQLELLRSLFHHPGVALTAVGDPNQSIYGWRGASATTLLRFPAEFAGAAGPADVLPLSTSWRNDSLILDAANAVAAPLATEHVQPLRPRPGAGRGVDRGGPSRDRRGGGRPRRGVDRRALVQPERPAHRAQRRRAVPAAVVLPARARGPAPARSCPSRSSASAACSSRPR